jgi:hypothetical protein
VLLENLESRPIYFLRRSAFYLLSVNVKLHRCFTTAISHSYMVALLLPVMIGDGRRTRISQATTWG